MKEKKKAETSNHRTPNRPANPRPHTVRFRIGDEEREELERRASAAGLNLSDYLRASALGDTGYRRGQGHELLGRAISELRRVGNNVNQIARHLNKGGSIEAGIIAQTMKALLGTLEAIRKAVL